MDKKLESVRAEVKRLMLNVYAGDDEKDRIAWDVCAEIIHMIDSVNPDVALSDNAVRNYVDADLFEHHVKMLHDEAKRNHQDKTLEEQYRQYWLGKQGAYTNILTAIRCFKKQANVIKAVGAELRYIEGRGIYIPAIDKVLAMKDSYEGKVVTFDKAGKAPSIEEWRTILPYREEINRLLIENGGEPLEEGVYWSRTPDIERHGCAWGVGLGGGSALNYYRLSDGCVRAVSAL